MLRDMCVTVMMHVEKDVLVAAKLVLEWEHEEEDL